MGGIQRDGIKGLANAGKIFLGNFYLDENLSPENAILQGYLRHTWESLQTGLGYDYSQFRNGWSKSMDRVDYLGGATYVTDEFSNVNQGVTIGNYLNMDITSSIGKGSFDKYVKTHPLYMHEYDL